MHAVASILIGRPAQGLKDLANPVIGNGHDSQLWKALAFARQGKWADAREKFKNVEFAIASLPLDLQRIVTVEAMRASLEVKDYAGASKRRSELEVIGVSPEAAARLCGAARPARRGARPRQGRARRLQVRRRLDRPAGGGRSQAARGRAAAEARRDQPGRRVARARNALDDLARRLDRGQDAADAVADLLPRPGATGTRSPRRAPRPSCSRMRKPRARRRTWPPSCSRSSSWAPRATSCRRSKRSGCSTNSAS